MTNRRTYKRRGTLHLIAGLLIASALIRLGAGTGQAVAESLEATLAAEHADDESTTMAGNNSAKAGTLLAALQAREAVLNQREGQYADRVQALRVTEAEIAQQLTALTTAEEALRATIALADTAAETDLARLATVYENMKPKEASALFEEMSPAFAAGFLGLMRPELAALIMTQLTPQTAYSISVVLAGRNVGVPTQ